MALSIRTGSRTPKGSDASFRQGVQANPGDNQIPADGYIDVPDEEPLDEPLDITSAEANPSPVYSENTIRSKAAKAQFASGGLITFADAYSKINSGMEQEIQQSIYKQSQLDAEKRRVGVMKEVVNQAGQQGVTPETLNAIRGLSVPQLDDPAEAKIALEKAFGSQYVNQHVATNPNTTKMVQDAGDKGLDMLDVTQEAILRGQVASSQLERVKAIEQNQSWVGWGVDIAKSLVPGYSWYKKHDIVSSAPTSSILPGGNTKDQINYLFGLPPAQMNEKLGEALDQLAKDNPQLAVEFARAVQNYSASEALFENMIAVVDVASVADVGILAARGLRATGKAAEAGVEAASRGTLKQALKDAVGAANKPSMKVEDAVAAAGDVDQSAILNAVKQSRLKGTSKENIEAFEELVDLRVPSIANPSSITVNPSRLGRTKANIVADVLGKNADSLVAALTRPNVVSRIDEGTAAFGKLIDETLAKVDEIHGLNMNNGIKDFRPIPNTSNVLNTNMLQIDIARPGGELFESAEAAETAARMTFKLKPGDATVKQQGGGFYLQINKNMDETSTGVRDLLIDTNHTNPETVTNAFIGALRSADGVLSKSQNEARKTATFAAEEMQRLVKQASNSFSNAVKGIGGKQRYDRVDRILADNRTTHNPITNNMGVYYNDLASFEEGWFKMFNTFPNEKDAIAYFTARQLNDFDYLARNIEVYTYKGRQGIQNFEVSSVFKGEDGTSTTAFTKPFEGKAVDKLPTSGEGHRIWVVDSKGGRVVEPHRLSAEDRNALYKALKDENYRYVQVFDPTNSGLARYVKDVSDTSKPVNFVATKDLRASSLKLTDQVPYREGGHVVYDNQAYIKQAQITTGKRGEKTYNGDKTLSAHTIRGEADEFVKDLETARIMLKDSDPNLANHVTTKLGMSMQEFRRTMTAFDTEQPFKVVDNKGSTVDRTKLKDEGIIDLTSSEYNLAGEMRTKFLGEKGDEIVSFSKGSGQNPVWKQEKARMMDPLRVINSSMRQIVDSAIYNNYKIKSAEEFIAQYGDLLNVSERQLRNAPLYHFYNPVWKTATEGDAVRLAAAKNAQRAMINLVETPTSVKATWQGAKHNFIQSVYKTLGKDAAEWVDESALFRTRDPIRFARSFAFHTSLGMFNPVQFFLQVQNIGSMTAIAGPRIAGLAHKDAFLLNMLRMNDSSEVMNYWAKQFGSPHFAELKRELTNSGFRNVGGTATYIDDVADAKMFQSSMGSVLDFGTSFYRYGEEINRTSAYSIAYREFREANPTKAITDADRRAIVTRADDLTTNMTRASNASVQQGFGSIPLQFFGYQWRLAEQVWTGAKGTGKLSRPETARLMAWNAMAYGIPVGVAGAATGVWPWYESLEVYAQNKGIDLDTNLFTSTFSRGVIETGLNHMTGAQWNFSDRYGPGGMPTLKEILSGEKGVEALLGVSGQAIGKVYKNLSPALFGVSTAFNTDEKKFPLTSHDVLDAMKTISTVNLATKAWMAHNLGVYESKTGVKLLDGQSGDASWPILLGMQPRDILKLYAKKDILRDQATALKDITGLVQKEVSRALQSETSTEAEKYWARARVYINAAGTLTPKQKNDMLAGSLRGFTDEQLNSVNMKWIKASPDGKTMDDRIKLLGIETQNRKGQ